MTRKLKRELFNLARESDLAGWRFVIRMVWIRVFSGGGREGNKDLINLPERWLTFPGTTFINDSYLRLWV